MRHSRPLGPSSTLSSSSGHGLVHGTHRPKGPQLAFTQEAPNNGPAKKKTKIIVILGIALPVLACVIGIAAWAVTTDVLRIYPRANHNAYNRFGHQGKTRIDNMQSRSDHDVDVFVLHGITPSTIAAPTKSTKSSKMSSTTSSSTTGIVTTSQTMPSPKASDILSRLISDMPTPKNPKSFIVFSPIADTGNTGSQRKGRRLDGKVILHDGEDLVAEESMIAEDRSQELGFGKVPFSKKRISSVESSHTLKPRMRHPAQKKINPKEKSDHNPRIFHSDITSENPLSFIKLPPRGESVTFPTNPRHSVNEISNRNGGVTQPRLTGNTQQRNNFPVVHQSNNNGYQNFDKKNIGLEQPPLRNSKQNYENGQFLNPGQGYQPSHFQQPAPPKFKNQDNSPQFQPHGPPHFPKQEPLRTPQQNQFPVQDNQQNNQFLMDNQRSPTFQKHQYTGSIHNQPITPQSSPHSSFSQNTFSQENSPAGSGGPQYFAPPPQTFHTKISYDQPPPKFGPSASIPTYEKMAQSSVHTGPDGTHHHHHHHHHREPIASNSDPIGDVNYSDAPRSNDADRLGTIGIGMGPSRGGITLQIGGGGLGGLLPLGTLGIAKNIISALLPRPQLGLNSKVFLGVEVGKGGGFSIG